MIAFAVTLKAHRIRAGCSQAQLAGKADFDHSYFSRLEAGQRNPSRAAIDAIAGALGYGDDAPERAQLLHAAGYLPDADLRIDPLVFRLQQALDRLGPVERQNAEIGLSVFLDGLNARAA